MDENEKKTLQEQKSKSLEMLLEQIASFDNKSSIIISILGIVFALSFTVIAVVKGDGDSPNPFVFAAFLLFLIFTIFALFFAVLVFMPRKRAKIKKHENYEGKSKLISEKNSITYYGDLKAMDENEYERLALLPENQGANFEQIKQNAIICSRKHKNLTISICLLIPIVIFFNNSNLNNMVIVL